MIQTYKHTGAAPLGGLLGGLVLGTAAAVLGALAYSFAINWIPLIYVNFLATLAYGALIGGCVYLGVKSGKVRNPILAGLLGLICGLVGYYYAWAFDLYARAGDTFTLNPLVLMGYIAWLYENGGWSIRNATPKGPILAGIWLVEAGTIIGIATVMPYRLISALAFCELCDCWTTKQEGVRRLPLSTLDDVRSMLERGQLAPLADIADLPEAEPVYLRLDLSRCERCDQSNFLSVITVMQTVDKKGEVSTQTTEVVKHATINGSELAYLQPVSPPVEIVEPQPEPSTDETASA